MVDRCRPQNGPAAGRAHRGCFEPVRDTAAQEVARGISKATTFEAVDKGCDFATDHGDLLTEGSHILAGGAGDDDGQAYRALDLWTARLSRRAAIF